MQDITRKNFEAELVNASLEQPVLLDIWAEWCGPCKALGPVLEKLETDYAGRFKLVKLDADAEPEIAQQLSQMFGVRSIPFCVLCQGGQPVDGFVGALPEARCASSSTSTCRAPRSWPPRRAAEAEELLADGDSEAAIDRLQAAVATNPDNATARYDYLRALLAAAASTRRSKAFEPVANAVVPDARLVAAGQWLRRWRRRRRRARRHAGRRDRRRTSATSTPATSAPRACSRRATSPARWTSCSRS
jgi:putative thioredoxin